MAFNKNAALAAAAILATTLAAAPAQAAVTYSFEALSSYEFDGVTATGSWSFTSPDFITGNATIPVSHLTTCSVETSEGAATCLAPSLRHFVNGPQDANEVASLHFTLSPSVGADIYYYFAPGSLEHYGSYDTVLFGTAQQGILTVTQAAGVVPEPMTGALLVAGLGLLGVAARRSRRG